jgi:hypothetical protein
MYELLILIIYILVTTAFASLYGATQNQISYTVSEGVYFRHHKFEAFEGLGSQAFHEAPRDSKYQNVYKHWGNRIGAAVIGVKASWWMGLILGLVIGITAVVLFWGDVEKLIRNLLWTTLIWISLFIGLHAVSSLYFISSRSVYLNPLYDKYYKAGVMHNSAYGAALASSTGALMYLMFKGG